MSTDVFKTRSKAFVEKIYGSVLGQIRSENVISDLEEFLRIHPEITSILDIGAGHAPVTLSLLHRNPNLTAYLVEPSSQLIEFAKENQKQFGIEDNRLHFFEGDLKDFIAKKDKPTYNLVICHATA